jgi:hypothetical protein
VAPRLIQLDLGAAATSADEELWPGDPAEDSGDLEKWGTQAPRFLHSAPGRIRTCDTRFRKKVAPCGVRYLVRAGQRPPKPGMLSAR